MNRYLYSAILLTSFLLIAGSTQAQPIAIDTTSNWQQWISGILGGNCVEVSNVQFSDHPYSAARFTNASDIGLNEGIVLSTGQVSLPMDTTADFFLNGIFNDPEGDSLLAQYAIQEIGYTGNASSYDATRLEFDFMAPSDQEISVRFVFASEEYPEFAPPNNSFFNDIFAFFVSESGNTSYINIANVPGTALPVTIGNINAVTNPEFYVENPGIDFAFDGYTVPITATFNALAGVQYHLIIAISDIGDPNFDSAVFLELATNTSQTVHGKAYFDAAPLVAADVNLYGFTIEPGAFDVEGTDVTNANGEFAIEGVEQGLYLVHVVPNNDAYPDALPLYYPGVILWEEAVGVGIACDSLDVDGPGMIFVTGPGEISGTIGQDPFGGRLRSNDLIPYEGVNVFLQDSASLEWRGFDVSDVYGEYNFQNLAAGTYYVYPDVAGIPIVQPRKVLISESSPSADGVNFQMNEDGVVNIQGNTPQILEAGTAVSWQVTQSNFYWLGNNAILKTGADTLINDTLYTTLIADGILTSFDPFNEEESQVIGVYRQESSRLYLRYLYEFGSVPYELVNRDILYFDLQSEVGDTLRYPDIAYVNEGIVTAIDTFELGGVTRYRWKIENITGSSSNEYFVSGLGNSKGLFNFLNVDGMDALAHLNTCYTDINSQSFFAQDMYTEDLAGILNNCFLVTGSTNELNIDAISVFPNPGSGSFNIQRAHGRPANVRVYDLSGRLLFSQKISAPQEIIQTERLNAGAYMIEVEEREGTTSRVRWLNQ